MILYFADRHLNILGQASTHLPKGIIVTDDLKTEDVETGVAIFECDLHFNKRTRSKVESWAELGNYILRSYDDEQELYTIVNAEIDTKKQRVYIYAEDDGLDLLNEVVGEYIADQSYPISHYIEKYAGGSGWEIGINEVEGLTRQLTFDSDETTHARLLRIAGAFNNCELSFSFEIDGLKIVKRYINIYEERGKDTGVQLRLNKEIDSIVTTKSIENLATALKVTGGTPDGAEEPITLSGYEYDDGDFYVEGEILKSREALENWSRHLWKGDESQQQGGHIVRKYSDESLSQAVLLENAIAELKRIRDMEINYEADIKDLPDEVRIGDRVNIIDDEGELYLSSRVLILETSASDNMRRAVLGEHLIKKDGISLDVERLAAQFAEAAKSAERAAAIAEVARTQVNDMEIGGANLLRVTNTVTTLEDSEDWKSSETGSSDVTVIDIDTSATPNGNVKKGFEIVGNSESESNPGVVQDAVPVTNGRVYTLSCYAKGSGTLGLRFGLEQESFELNDETAWVKYSGTFIATTDSVSIGYQNSGSGTIQVCGMKLEAGNKSTDWTPATEDLNASSVINIPNNDACVGGTSYRYNNKSAGKSFGEYIKTSETFSGDTENGILLKYMFTTTGEQVYYSNTDIEYYCIVDSEYFKVQWQYCTDKYPIPQFSMGSRFELLKDRHTAGDKAYRGEVGYHKGEYEYVISQEEHDHMSLYASYISSNGENSYYEQHKSKIDLYPGKIALESDMITLNGLPFDYDSGWIEVDFAAEGTDFTHYANTQKVMYRRVGKQVFIRGSLNPTATLDTSTEQTAFTLPEGFRPTQAEHFLCQGSNEAKWLCTIKSSGAVTVSRYGTTETGKVSTSTWLPLSVSFLVG